jgi:hypothetical protein
LPGVFVVTYLNDGHYGICNGPNTLQIQLYPDGRIVFAYRGITSLNTGTIVGLTPGPNLPSQAADFSQQLNFDVPAGTAVYEYFTAQNLFDLDGAFIIFTPKQGGGYNVRTLVQPQNLGHTLSGISPNGSTNNQGPQSGPGGASAASLANAEVIVHSSANVKYVGMTNTDALGNFTLNGVPPGGISVQVMRNGKVIGVGGGLFPGGSLTTAQALTIGLELLPTSTKTTPQP